MLRRVASRVLGNSSRHRWRCLSVESGKACLRSPLVLCRVDPHLAPFLPGSFFMCVPTGRPSSVPAMCGPLPMGPLLYSHTLLLCPLLHCEDGLAVLSASVFSVTWRNRLFQVVSDGHTLLSHGALLVRGPSQAMLCICPHW